MLLLQLLFRDTAKVSVLATIWVLLFFAHGHIFEIIESKAIAGFVIGRQRYLLLAEVVASVVALGMVLRVGKLSYSLTPYFSASLALLVVINTGIIVQHNIASSSADSFRSSDTAHNVDLALQQSQMPDIYYIILDGYAREDVLRGLYNFDNSRFLNHLQDNGFYVAGQSRANYVTTQASLASSLNMDHVVQLTQSVGANSSDGGPLRRMIRDNEVSRFAKSIGYRFVFLPSTWGPTRWNPHADAKFRPKLYPFGKVGELFLSPVLGNDLGSALLHFSALWPLADKWILENNASLFVKNFEQMIRIPELEGPTFTFAHFLPPHPPYVFDRDGNVRDSEFSLTTWQDRDPYLDQLVWVNKSIEDAIDHILERAKDSSVIIIQSDHGSRFSDIREVIATGGQPDQTLVWERSSILNTYHLPKMCESNGLYQTITPVNTFRLVFNSCLGTEFEYLEDETYWSSHKRPYDFTKLEHLPIFGETS